MRTVVLSLGGSVINSGRISVGFLKKFKKIILSRKERFVIVCGGGSPAREYSCATRCLGLGVESQDKVGISATLLNAQLVRELFGKSAFSRVVLEPEKVSFGKVLVAAGWKPGCSTDRNAVLWARVFGVGEVFNLSNVDFVYDKDPKKFRCAKPIRKLCWKDFKEKIAKKWVPGLNVPFDPEASKLAEKLNIKVFFVKGFCLDRFVRAVDGKNFKGTLIG